MRKKLPPYGLSVTKSSEPIWLFAGYSSQSYTHLKHHYPNTMGIFLWEDPQNYRWPVKGRKVIIFVWLSPKDEYLERLSLALFQAQATDIYIYNSALHQQINYKRN